MGWTSVPSRDGMKRPIKCIPMYLMAKRQRKDETMTKTEPGLSKQLINLIRQRAAEGPLWQALADQADDFRQLGKQIAARKAELAHLDAEAKGAQAAVAGHKAEAAKMIAAAEKQAARIIDSADAETAKAEAYLQRANAKVKDAETKANEIVTAAEAEARELTRVFDELRAKVQ
jgi:F0F1-type ATP synthase membrane subunit b/b'